MHIALSVISKENDLISKLLTRDLQKKDNYNRSYARSFMLLHTV